MSSSRPALADGHFQIPRSHNHMMFVLPNHFLNSGIFGQSSLEFYCHCMCFGQLTFCSWEETISCPHCIWTERSSNPTAAPIDLSPEEPCSFLCCCWVFWPNQELCWHDSSDLQKNKSGRLAEYPQIDGQLAAGHDYDVEITIALPVDGHWRRGSVWFQLWIKVLNSNERLPMAPLLPITPIKPVLIFPFFNYDTQSLKDLLMKAILWRPCRTSEPMHIKSFSNF